MLSRRVATFLLGLFSLSLGAEELVDRAKIPTRLADNLGRTYYASVNSPKAAYFALNPLPMLFQFTGQVEAARGRHKIYATVELPASCAAGTMVHDTTSNRPKFCGNDGVTWADIGQGTIGSGANNIAIGTEALDSNTTGYFNIAIGYRTLTANTIGTNNIAIGKEAMLSNIDGTYNVAIGTNAMQVGTTHDFNVAVGIHTLLNNTGNNNVAVGYNTLTGNLGGASNTGVGSEVLEANTSGFSNTAIGFDTMAANIAGGQHTAVGSGALSQHNAANNDNVAVGYQAGYNSGTPSTGNANCTFVGSGANSSADFLGNCVALGYQAQVTESNSVALGNSSTTYTRTGSSTTAQNDYLFGSRLRYIATGTKALTESSATAVFNLMLPSGSGSGAIIDYTVDSDDATDFQARSGSVRVAGVNKAGTETCAVYGVDSAFTVNPIQTQDGSGAGVFSLGTLTYTWTSSNSPTNGCQFLLNAVSSLTQTTLKITGQVRKNGGTGAIVWQ